LHVKPQLVPSHVPTALAGTVHAVHEAPHVAGELLLTHAPAHSWNPALHVKPQLVPSHVAVASDGAVQGVHDDVPHDAGEEFAAHVFPQTWYPALHVRPHVLAAQTGCPLASPGQTLPHEEQLFASLVVSVHLPAHCTTHDAMQVYVPASPCCAQVGAVLGQRVVQLPQLAGKARFVSQPVSGLPSQSA
jgi:hypothetical protein